jgi:ureidoacrylate peracid hydrolase
MRSRTRQSLVPSAPAECLAHTTSEARAQQRRIMRAMERAPLPPEIAEPATSAVLVIDVQNDFVHPDGVRAPSWPDFAHREMVEHRLASFLDGARTAGARIVWIAMDQTPESVSPANARMKRKMYPRGGGSTPDDADLWEAAACRRGTWGAELYLAPVPPDLVMTKSRYSAFLRTDLDEQLRALGVTTVLVTGVVMSQCVESTARDAYQCDFDVVLVEDCAAARTPEERDATCRSIEQSFGWVRRADELLAMWAARRAGVPAAR